MVQPAKLDRETESLQAQYREAVKDAIADLHAKGLSAIQVRDGYLVALQPDGVVRKLYKLRRPPGEDLHGAPHAARRT